MPRPPLCKTCGVREFGHVCGGAGAQSAPPAAAAVPQLRRREGWRRRGETDAADDPVELHRFDKRTQTYAPPGECAYCDERRKRARHSMAALRERGDGV